MLTILSPTYLVSSLHVSTIVFYCHKSRQRGVSPLWSHTSIHYLVKASKKCEFEQLHVTIPSVQSQWRKDAWNFLIHICEQNDLIYIITQLINYVHGPRSGFKNKASICRNPNALDWIWSQGNWTQLINWVMLCWRVWIALHKLFLGNSCPCTQINTAFADNQTVTNSKIWYNLVTCLHIKYTVPGRQGRQKIIPQKTAEKINNFVKYFVEINKNEVNKNCRQKTKENVSPLVKFNVSY
jgi:hypothetical protein